MKRCILAITAFVFLAMFVSLPSVNATDSWMTYREDISISGITVDIDIESVNVTGNEISTNVTLPCVLSELDNASTITRINASSNCSFNLTVNGGTINSSTTLNTTNGMWANISLATVLATGNVSETDTYIDLLIEVNSTSEVTAKAYIVADDASCYSSWVTSVQTVKEKDIGTPSVGETLSLSYMTVNNSLVLNHTVGYSLTDVNATLSYPSHATSEPYSYINFGTVANNTDSTNYVNYQKRGPYVYDVDEGIDGTQHTVDIYVKSEELLTSTVEYLVTTSSDEYEGYFDTLNYDTLNVEFNDVDVDWEEGSIVLEDLTMREGWSINHLAFTWSESVTPPAEEEVAWYAQNLFGIAIYLWLAIVAVIAIVGVLIVVYIKD